MFYISINWEVFVIWIVLFKGFETFIYIARYTIQIVSKKLCCNKQENNSVTVVVHTNNYKTSPAIVTAIRLKI